MELIAFWLIASIVVGVIATARRRNGFGWFLLALLISPLLACLLVLALGEPIAAAPQPLHDFSRRPCPYCAEPIKLEARLCPHCRSEVAPLPAVSAREYPESFRGLRFRRQRDGSVVVATANGPHRFDDWKSFWEAANRPG